MKILLVSVPAPAIKQTAEERKYWRWHYALKTKLTYPNLSEKQLLSLGNSENQNIGLLSIASSLRENGIKVHYLAPSLKFVDQREERFSNLVSEQVQNIKPEFIGFSAHTCAIPTAINYAKKVKKLNPKIKTLIGGAHANGSSNEMLDELINNFDFVIKGKGEIPTLERIDGKKRQSKTTEPYPNPANDLLNVQDLPAARVFTSLGCRKKSQCVFCADTLHNKEFVTKPIDEVIKEIRFLYHSFGTRYFYFGDENFFLDKKRALDVMEKINKLNLEIIVGYQVRVESADEDLIRKAAESGKCTEIQYGVESASQEILNLNRKGLRIQRVKEVCDLTKTHGINAHCYFLVGLPGETEETAELTIEKIREMVDKGIADFVEYRCVVPFPGSLMWEQAKKFGVNIIHKDWSKYRGENIPPFNLVDLSAEKIYGFYLRGLEIITKSYQNRYLGEFGTELPEVNILSAVTEGGF